MDKRPSIAVAGSVNVDLIMRVGRVPEPGETLHSGSFSVAPGGKGANQAVSLARLGADVIFVGRAGENFFCDMVTQSLEEAGVSTDFLIRDKENHTGTVVVLVDSEGQNAMVPDYGANLHLSAGDIERAADAIRSSDMLSFSSRYRKMLTFELSRLQRIVRFRSCSILLRGFLPALSF